MNYALRFIFSLMFLTSIPSVLTAQGSCSTTNCASDCNDCTELCKGTCITNLCNKNEIYGKTFYAVRSQGDNSARKMMGTEDKIHVFGNTDWYGVGFVAVEYQRMFNNKHIGTWFTSNGQATMSYGIIDTTAENSQFDLNSLQFGVTSSGTIAFCPQSSDIIADLNIYVGLDNLFCGLWTRLDIPIAHSSRQLNIVEVNDSTASSVYPDNVYGSGFVAVPSALLVEKPMTAALNGGTDSAFGSGLGAVPALNYGKVGCKRTATNVAGIRFDIGFDWFRRERWHLASSYDFVFPVGSTPSAEYLFDAMVSDSKRAQIGSTFNFWYRLWDNCDATHTINFYADATINTMLGKYVQRLIGLNPRGATAQDATWSQYLVLKKFNSAFELTGLERAANILATRVKVEAFIDFDIALMAQWNHKCAFAGLGYELWLRSKEEATHSCLVIPADTYAIKGVTTATTAAAAGSLLVAPNATINTIGTPVTVSAQSTLPSNVAGSYYDYSRALHPLAVSNKVFGFVGYNWTNCACQPFVLVGGEAEFGNHNKALSQWGVLAKGGASF